jgi:hypothetical protein
LGCLVKHPNVGLAHPLRTESASGQALTLEGVPQAEPWMSTSTDEDPDAPVASAKIVGLLPGT